MYIIFPHTHPELAASERASRTWKAFAAQFEASSAVRVPPAGSAVAFEAVQVGWVRLQAWVRSVWILMTRHQRSFAAESCRFVKPPRIAAGC